MTPPAIDVRRIRHRTASVDPLADQLRLASVLERADVRPPGLAPSAVLCIRRLGDPLPRRLRIRTGQVRPPPEWERAATGALEQALRAAARPAHEAVPASANAVVFADRSELLACLAADWLSGELASRWWWPGLVGGDTVRAAVAPRVPATGDAVRDVIVRAWFAEPRYVAAAIELLAARGEAVRLVASLAPEQAALLTVALARAVALPALAVAAEAVIAAGGGLRPAPPHAGAPAPPWRFVAPETATEQLAPAQELLLGVALGLRRSPVLVRAPAFVEAIHRWSSVFGDERPAGRPPHEAAPDGARRSPANPRARRRPPLGPRAPWSPHARASEQRPPTAPTVAPAAAERVPRAERPSLLRGEDVARRAEAAAAPIPSPSALAEAADAVRPVSRVFPSPTPERPSVPGPRRPRLEPTRPVATTRSASPPPASPPPEAIDTELGGLFFLLNFALHLGLVADFSAPDDPGVGPDPWDLVALLGARLLRESSPADPVWPLLARLAGRGRREPPGRDFAPPDDWRVPPGWLAPWPETGDWTWSASRGRLRVVHPAGFAVLDVAGDASALERELSPYAASAGRLRRARIPGDGARGRPATRWAHRLARYARPRLALALGTDDQDLLLRRPARVLVTPSHVDVVLSLAQHPIEIRLAGLDRDPGWIPAAGRFLAFRFE